jgi:hypothetical protein
VQKFFLLKRYNEFANKVFEIGQEFILLDGKKLTIENINVSAEFEL